jgi:threonine/homoserine/homoserine lactone efflux protein
MIQQETKVVAFSGALMPGPLLTVTVSESTRRGALSGGAILLWMAFSMFKSLPELRLELTAKDTQTKNLVLCGVLFSLANPY